MRFAAFVLCAALSACSSQDPNQVADIDQGQGLTCGHVHGDCASTECTCNDDYFTRTAVCSEGACWTADQTCENACDGHGGVRAEAPVANVNASPECGAVTKMVASLACAEGPYAFCQVIPAMGECEASVKAWLSCLATTTPTCNGDVVVWSGACTKDPSLCTDAGTPDAAPSDASTDLLPRAGPSHAHPRRVPPRAFPR